MESFMKKVMSLAKDSLDPINDLFPDVDIMSLTSHLSIVRSELSEKN